METKFPEQFKEPKLKRIFDLFFSLILFLLLLPLFIIIILFIFIEHAARGQFFSSIFYIEPRISQGRVIKIIKFNIFKPEIISEKEKNNEMINIKELEHDANNLIWAGRMIQKIYFDELPQLINIIKGDISIVGPRPVNLLVFQIELNRGNFIKYIIKAGLTGNYQSKKGLTKETQFKLDSEYIDYCFKHSPVKIFLNDLKIIFRTLKVVIMARGI